MSSLVSSNQLTQLSALIDDHVTLPPRASLMITVYCGDAVPVVDAIAESDQSWLLDRGVSAARGIARFKQWKSHALVTNFTEEYQHLNKGAAIPFLEETQESSDVIAVADFERASEDVSSFRIPST